MKRFFVTALVLSLAIPGIASADSDWSGKFNAKTKATGRKA